MPGTAKVLGLHLSRTCFFSNGKFSVSNKIVGELFVCLSVVGFSLVLVLVFDLLLQLVILLTLTSYFFLCFA